ncbi:hypothetical protein PF005_g25679 [Phytophthora fragariae]|uniref:Uncharacterized protein n=1 Tax=Phytophthora fragariae TaxID=53985 RepID=A0A6A3RAP9_9STRA|nr:hypothetical protein PF003_g26756 [Phytophthora fragariae]KAE8923746.1 hypothetical protein PF009_g26009 [Phytophthora fragariae]KAE9078032.1 hypothetical protein PF007_g24024 [Phytophthora fragariae]KAE9093245.1 hypothetical protein PF006_g24484 [Phytophthora fragariae]KAE9174829.1 hypothetical protein PF005_g25679 [Phytophthora fragariae]
MTRGAAAWNACNRVLDERWHESQWQAHRDRIELIQSASSVSAQAFSSALAASARPRRIHTSRANWNASSPVKLVARSKSPAAKSRQKQIDHDNLVLIKKIVALDNAKSSGAKKRRKSSQSHSKAATARSHDKIKNTIVVPKPAHANHECLQPLPEIPQSAASHVMYTRGSATMKNNFVEYNAPTMMHASNATSAAARVRSRAQSKILVENKKILRRILSARTTVDRSALQQHEEKHNRLLSIMTRHHSTPRLPQQQPQPQPLRASRSQSNFAQDVTGVDQFVGIRVDPTSHLTQAKPRPRSASHASSRTRIAAVCPQSLHTARRSASSESLVSRIRNMTLASQRHDM